MAKRKNSKRPDREGQKIQNAGFAALVIGFAFLISPMFIGQYLQDCPQISLGGS